MSESTISDKNESISDKENMSEDDISHSDTTKPAHGDTIYDTVMSQEEGSGGRVKRKKQESGSEISDTELTRGKENLAKQKKGTFTLREEKKSRKVTAESGHGGSSISMWAGKNKWKNSQDQSRSHSCSSDEGEKATNRYKRGENRGSPPPLERAIRYKARINSREIEGGYPSEKIAQIRDKVIDKNTLWAVYYNETSYGDEIVFAMTTEKARDDLTKIPIGENQAYMEPVTVEMLTEKRQRQVRVRDLYNGILEEEVLFSLSEYGEVVSLWLENRRGMVQAIVEYNRKETAEKVISLEKVYVGGDHAFTYPMDNWMHIEDERKKYTLKLSNLPFNCSGKEINHWLESINALGITIKRHYSGIRQNCGIVHFKNAEDMKNAKIMSRRYKDKVVFFCPVDCITCFICGDRGHIASLCKYNRRNTSPTRDISIVYQEKKTHLAELQEGKQADYTDTMDKFNNRLTEIENLLNNVQVNIQKTVQEAVSVSLIKCTTQCTEQKQQTEKEIVDKEGRKALEKTDNIVRQLQMKLEKLEKDINTKTAASEAKLDKILEAITKRSSSPALRVSEQDGAQ